MSDDFNAEIEAIEAVLKIMAPFDPTSRMRILEYAQNWSRDRKNAPEKELQDHG